ncbi:MAG TPA: cytochrome c3 family protein [Aquabacterium sp.]|uniref:cytochrome c3 family protein n=1 Tax=Aquabacterium sp. TaxID=1872578 RepID=UPI002E30C3E4|nr:cytochrome c3 family protein [Aquabacterium sp.]HEX5355577.1 cytochrome c3 family protein [Aquabacterium sp.]
MLLLVMCVMLGVVPGRAEAQSATNSKFEHFKTGFPLNGAHATQRCESCHSNGIFKGTPKDCQTCHTQGSRLARSNVVMPPTHIPTNSSTQGCDSCHGTQSFSNPRFSHTTGIPPGTACQTCHDGVRAQGKSGNHIATRATCDSCHTTRNWNGAKPDHSGFHSGTNCASCHNGATASGKTSNHIPVTANCFSCHSVNSWKPSSWNHTQAQVAGACSTCHSGSFAPADGKPANHIPYQSLAGVSISNCDSCHKNGFSSWNPGRFHANVNIVGQCASCHLTSAFGLTSKPNSPVHSGVTGSCESCHSTAGWAGAKVDHSLFNTSTQCGTCHNGSTATGKPGSHMPVTGNCVSCHSVKGWKPTSWNHTQALVAGACSTCHSGSFPPADGKPANHIPYQSLAGVSISNCDSCHKGGYSSWNPGRFHANVSIVGQCASCHLTSTYGLTSKPATTTHSGVTGNCESCHATSAWSNIKVDHNQFNAATQCSNCHNGSTATGKSSSHIPVTANCYSCHSTTGWTPTKWNHTQVNVSSACSTCHSGAFPPADGRPSNHIPYQSLAGAAITNCDTCHKSGYSSWNPGRFHANVSIVGQCASCHLTSAYGLTSKPNTATHSTVTGGCESCHNTSGWAGAKVDHSLFNASTQCSTCHNGGTATGKPGSHIPVTANCYSCHSTTGWTPTKWNHTQVNVSNTCSTCHSGAFPPADGRPSNHIPYQSLAGAAITNCDTCHKSGYSSWNPGRFHANVSIVGQCASCHLTSAYGLTSKPNTATHSTVTGGCESCHNTSSWAGAKVNHSLFNATTQCASCHNGSSATGKPGSHIPVTANCYSCHNTTGWTPTKWNHTQVTVTNACSTCHSGAFPPADGRPSNHIPYQSLAGAAITNCDTCHKNGFSSWSPGRFHANVSIVGQCASCHLTSVYGLTSKPANALHSTVTGGCESCHNTSGWNNAKVNHSLFNATTQCGSCHNGSAATGKPGSHIPVTANCYSCHNTTGWTPTKWNHTQVTVTNACSTCHSGAYPPADGRPANHIPYQSLAGAAITNCDSCHKSGYSSWSPGRFHANVSIVGQCSTCHLSAAYGLTSKPNNAVHAGISSGCESCHKSTASWSNVVYTHAPTNAVGTGTCDNCHNGSTATGKPGNHIPIQVGGVKCDSCHKSQQAWATTVTTNHTAMSTQACKSCHTQAYVGWGATAKPNNHIPEAQLLNGASLDCKACHTSTNAGGFGTAVMNHNNSMGNGSGWCYACHNAGTAYLGSMERKSLTHRQRTGVTDCSQSGCHRPLGTKGNTYRNWD